MVLFGSPRRLLEDLTDLAAVCGPDRRMCVARELSKLFEEVWWGSISSAVDRWTTIEPRGEFTLVLAPADKPADLDHAIVRARELIAGGASRSEAARQAAAETGAPRRSIYEGI